MFDQSSLELLLEFQSITPEDDWLKGELDEKGRLEE